MRSFTWVGVQILFLALGAFAVATAQANTNLPSPAAVQAHGTNSASTGKSQTLSSDSFNKDLPVWVNNLIALFAAIVAAVNLVAVVYFFIQANADRTRERAEDKSERSSRVQQEVGNFWIKELILRSSNAFIHEFFDKHERKIAEFHAKCGGSSDGVDSLRADSAKMIQEFKTEFHQLESRVIEPLEWVSPEFQKLRPILESLEDLVTEEFGTIRLPVPKTKIGSGETAEMKFRKIRSEFFKQLHSAHKISVGL